MMKVQWTILGQIDNIEHMDFIGRLDNKGQLGTDLISKKWWRSYVLPVSSLIQQI